MTIVLDTSALLALAVAGDQRDVVLDALDGDRAWLGGTCVTVVEGSFRL